MGKITRFYRKLQGHHRIDRKYEERMKIINDSRKMWDDAEPLLNKLKADENLYTPEEKELLDEGKKYIGLTPFLLGTTISQKDYTEEEQKIIDKAKQCTGVIEGPPPELIQGYIDKLIQQEKDYKLELLKKKCSIEFNDNVPDSIKEKFLLYCVKKGIYNLKSWNELIQREGKSKISQELLDTVKDDPEYNKWSVETFFKDSLELCIRKDDGTLKNWVIDEALKQSILDE